MLFAPNCGCLFALYASKKILNERGFAWIHRNYCLLLPRKTFQGGVSPGQSCKITFAFISKELADAIIGTVENSPRKNTS